MSRVPTERELLGVLAAAVESDDADEELAALLSEHAGSIASSLNMTVAQLEGACGASPMDRTVTIRVALRRRREQGEGSLRRQAQNLSIAAADMLVGLSRWHGERIDIDHKIVLGGLLADRMRKAIRFDVEGYRSVTILRDRLLRAKRALRFSDLSSFINARGLNFRWNAGRGGLVLFSQDIGSLDTNAILQVHFPRPRPKQMMRPAIAAPTTPSPSWLGDVLLDLAYL
jgi:hypothetical protein